MTSTLSTSDAAVDALLGLRFERHLVRLRFTGPARFHFQHGVALDGMLRTAGGATGLLLPGESHRLPHEVTPYACESGRVRFEPGEPYHFLLTVVGEAISIVGRLVDGISSVGRSKPARDAPLATLAGNFEVTAAEQLHSPDWMRDAERISSEPGITLRFLSPLRIERPEALRQPRHRYLDQSGFHAPAFLERLWRRLLFLSGVSVHEHVPTPRIPEGLGAAALRLLWIDIPKTGGNATGKRETPGGVVGSVALLGVPDEWCPLLALGQHLHAGENTHTRYGMGRYLIDGSSLAYESALAPARSLLSRVTDPDLLADALKHLRSYDSSADGEREPDPIDLDRLSIQLATGTYDPPPLNGFIQRKPDGGVRALVVPALSDRTAQRAAQQVLAPSVDALLEDCSYAYRKGFSRAGAAQAISRAYDDGYRYVLDADITSFFDAVNWDRVESKLAALFPAEPLNALLERWIEAPVVFDGKLIQRRRGLPQGSPLSPLLANLYLDEFDEELLGDDYRLVRYADDFVVLCRDLDEAHAARQRAQEALSRLDLTLNERKTSIRAIDDGFVYLGYLFCRSVVTDDEGPGANVGHELEISDVPRLSWLAEVPFERVRQLTSPSRVARAAERRPRPLAPLASAPVPATRAVYALAPGDHLKLHNDRLTVSGSDTTVEIPLSLVSHVVCNRAARVTVPLLLALAEAGKPVFFCSRDGSVTASVSPHPPDWTAWMQQSALLSNPEASVAFAREIVMAKLHNTATLVVRLGLSGRDETAASIRHLEASAVNKSDLDSLRGLEGAGAAAWFAALRDTLPKEWGFVARRRTPPPDPVNAMLSFAYTVLHHHCAASITAAGLNPRLGIFHEPRGAHDALASDLIEELRHLADAFVISLIRHHQIGPAGFRNSGDGRWPCLLSAEARRTFLTSFETRLMEQTTPDGGEPMSWRQAIDRQVSQVRAIVRDPALRYRPLRLHA